MSDSSIASIETPQISITDENDDTSSVYTSSKGADPEKKKKKSVRHGLQALVDHSAFQAQTERGESISAGSSASDPRTRTSDCQFTVDSAVQTGRSVGRIAEAGMKVPMEVMMGLSKGFHNIPRLYGDEPRKVEKVTGFSSGLKVAGREFGQGLYEGFTGLVTEPYKGAKEDGVGGFVKGIGKGMVGIAMKPQAGKFDLSIPFQCLTSASCLCASCLHHEGHLHGGTQTLGFKRSKLYYCRPHRPGLGGLQQLDSR